jgi:hypothetical protein
MATVTASESLQGQAGGSERRIARCVRENPTHEGKEQGWTHHEQHWLQEVLRHPLEGESLAEGGAINQK